MEKRIGSCVSGCDSCGVKNACPNEKRCERGGCKRVFCAHNSECGASPFVPKEERVPSRAKRRRDKRDHKRGNNGG